MNFEVTGKLEKYLDVQEGKTKSDEVWKKQSFVVKSDESFNNLYCFDLFAKGDKLSNVENLTKYNKVGDSVKVSFNVSTNEYNGKYYTSLNAWRVENSKQTESSQPSGGGDDLPF
jgi:hypothetical protein